MTAHGTIFHNSIGKRPPTGGVGQDKAGQKSADARPNDAGLVTKMLQPGEQRIAANIYCQHTKKRNCSERRVKMGFWVKQSTAAEIRRRAEQTGLSASATGANFLDQIVMQDLQIQHVVLLQPMVEQAMRKEMRHKTELDRLCHKDISRLLRLVYNILVRMPDNPQMSEASLNQIRDESANAAYKDMQQRLSHTRILFGDEHQNVQGEEGSTSLWQS